MNLKMFVVALPLVVGCGDGISVDAYQMGFRQTVCEKAYGCATNGEAPGWPYADRYGTTLDECRAMRDENLDRILESIAAGRIEYDGNAAEDCLAAWQDRFGEATCPESFGQLSVDESACREVYVGTVGPGGACYSGADCTGEASCATTGGQLPGTCG